jgi:hypothetical protein
LQALLRFIWPPASQADHYQLFQCLPLSRLACQHLAQQALGPARFSLPEELLRVFYFIEAVFDAASRSRACSH